MNRRHLHKHGDRHHRRPRSRGGGSDKLNISRVHSKYHKAWHLLFGNASAREIAQIINEVWLDPRYYFACMPRKRKKRRKFHRYAIVICENCGDVCRIERLKKGELK